MTLVVFVFATTLMLAEGLRKTLVNTGSYDNVLILRSASSTEIQSSIDRYQASVVETQPEIAIGEQGRRLIAKELSVIINLPKKKNRKTFPCHNQRNPGTVNSPETTSKFN